MIRLALIVILLVTTSTTGAQQPTAVEIRGVVVDAGTGAPLARAAVTAYLVFAADRPSVRILTDDQGQFVLPVRASYVHVSKGGFATTVVEVPDGRDMPRPVALVRGAAISGRVVDDTGQPTAAVVVRAAPVGAPGVTLSTASYFIGRSDDRGEYRIGGLPAGRYAITAVTQRFNPDEAALNNVRLRQGAPLALTAMTEASVVDVFPGDQSVAADLVVPAPSTSCGFATPVVDPDARGSIRGRVAVAGRPFRCGTVRLRRPGVMRQVLVTNTDAEGWFEFRGVPAGSYVVEATEFRHLPNEAAVEVAADQRVDNVRLALAPLPAITGTVVDEHGEPVQGAFASVFQLRMVQGRLAARRAATAGGETNDRGEYRFYGLQPGDYLVSVATDGVISGSTAARPLTYAPTFFPSSPALASAAMVTVAAASDTAGIVVTLSPSSAGRVTGRVFDRAGRAFDGAVTLAVSDRSGGIWLEPRQTRVSIDGSFAFDNVGPGEYVVQAFVRPSFAANTEPQFGMQYVIVNESLTSEVLVRMTAGATIEGRVIVEGQALPDARPVVPVPTPVEFDRSPLIGAGIPAVPSGPGQFRATGVTGPRRFVLATGSSDGWYIKSARVNGSDVTRVPFDFGLEEVVFRDVEVVISSAGAALEGTTVDDRQRPVVDYTVVLFSTQRDDWYPRSERVKVVQSGADGRFRMTSVPPGDYYVIAAGRLEGPDADERWQDVSILEQLVPLAERLSVSEGERLAPRLRMLRQ